MKIVTISKIGYNHLSQANWSYGIHKIDLIDTKQPYCMGHTVYETFGGNDRLMNIIEEKTGYRMIETKGVYTGTGTPKITGIKSMLDAESDEIIEEIANFLSNTK